MMTVSLDRVRLDTSHGDCDAVLILREGALFGVASRLSASHADLAGRWFVEAMFGDRDRWIGTTFSSEHDLIEWAASVDEIEPAQQMRA